MESDLKAAIDSANKVLLAGMKAGQEIGHRSGLRAGEAVAKALEDVLREAVILSAEYLESFKDKPDDATIQGWDKARWMRALAACRSATRRPGPAPTRPASTG